MPALAILSYHRIVKDDDDRSWPYLERGTAVRARVFEAQLAAISRVADIISEDVALDVLSRRQRLARASVWLTFDDGYSDVMHTLPLLETGTVFQTTITATSMLPADAWYAVLLSATRTMGVVNLGAGPFEFNLSTPAGRARLVNGPERRVFLRASPMTQRATLDELARQLDANPDLASLYLDEAALRTIVEAGWSVGSHGLTHTPFDALCPDEVRYEAVASLETLRALGRVRSVALPDGAPAHLDVLRRVGYDCVLGLGDAVCAPGAEVQPRFLVPDDPTWVNRVLIPALAGDWHD